MIPRVILAFAALTVAAFGGDFNAIVLEQIHSMPSGGGYATTREAHTALSSSVAVGPGGVSIRPATAQPSYCSGATYLVLLRALGEAQKRGMISLNRAAWSALLPAPMSDGHGVWGRWNANGPGAAHLVHELGAGRNFTAWDEARPGDFLKIFWTDAVGKRERGHLVVFLGTEDADGVERVRFWSSNKPRGYGEKSVRKNEIARALFTRIESPEAFARVTGLPDTSPYLAGLLTRESSFPEAVSRTGAR